MGFLDASEQPPTFGAKFTDIRGFTLNGWTDFGNRGVMRFLHETRISETKYNPHICMNNTQLLGLNLPIFEDLY